MDYEFKNKNNNVKKEIKEVIKVEEKVYKSKNPNFTWSDRKYRKGSLEFMLQNFEDEHKERCSGVKSEFVSNTEKGRIDLKNAKKRDSKDKKNRED